MLHTCTCVGFVKAYVVAHYGLSAIQSNIKCILTLGCSYLWMLKTAMLALISATTRSQVNLVILRDQKADV